ncbi:hypothetical protein ACWKSP_35605 [Micromonosporaceae bacterium Da 78-11]
MTLPGAGPSGGAWPSTGTWIIAPASAAADWRTAAVALATAAQARVVVVVLGPSPADDEPARLLRARVDGYLQLGAAVTRDEAAAQVRALTRARSLVLIAATPGPLAPVGLDGWTLADLALDLPASAMVITAPGDDPADTVDALTARGIPASVVAFSPADLRPAPAPTADVLQSPVPAPPGNRVRTVLRLLALLATLLVVGGGLSWWRFGIGSSGGPTTTGGQRPATTATTARAVPVVTTTQVAACPQYGDEVTATRADPDTVARVGAAWTRIEKWLAEKAPAGSEALRPPATATQIDHLQRRMSVAFPADLVASLARHDGGLTLPPDFTLESTAQIVSTWMVNCAGRADKALVPFAAAADGRSLYVDQRPGGRGRIDEFGPDLAQWPASLTELLEQTATALETGDWFAGRYRPMIDDGRLAWETR